MESILPEVEREHVLLLTSAVALHPALCVLLPEKPCCRCASCVVPCDLIPTYQLTPLQAAAAAAAGRQDRTRAPANIMDLAANVGSAVEGCASGGGLSVEMSDPYRQYVQVDVQGVGGSAHFFSAEATRDQEQLDIRKSEHQETGDHIMPHHLSYGAARPNSVTDTALREHFHLPLSEAAKKFSMCTTAFKKLCRKQVEFVRLFAYLYASLCVVVLGGEAK